METPVAFAVLHKAVALFVILSAIIHILVSSLRKVIVIHKVVARVIGRVYEVPNFDTKKKALSSRKRLKKA